MDSGFMVGHSKMDARSGRAADLLAEMRIIVRDALISWRHQHPRVAAAPILGASAEAGGPDGVPAGEKLAIESLIARDLPDPGFQNDAECASCSARGRDAHAPPRSGAAASSEAS